MEAIKVVLYPQSMHFSIVFCFYLAEEENKKLGDFTKATFPPACYSLISLLHLSNRTSLAAHYLNMARSFSPDLPLSQQNMLIPTYMLLDM